VAGALLVRLGGLPLFATVCTLIYAFVPVLVFRRALRLGAAMAPALGCTVLAFAVLSSHSLAPPPVGPSPFFALFPHRLDDSPQGWRLHASIRGYLGMQSLGFFNEFMSPNFLGGSVPVLAFEALALLVLLVLARAVRRLPWVHTAFLVFFLHESLHSVRHMNL